LSVLAGIRVCLGCPACLLRLGAWDRTATVTYGQYRTCMRACLSAARSAASSTARKLILRRLGTSRSLRPAGRAVRRSGGVTGFSRTGSTSTRPRRRRAQAARRAACRRGRLPIPWHTGPKYQSLAAKRFSRGAKHDPGSWGPEIQGPLLFPEHWRMVGALRRWFPTHARRPSVIPLPEYVVAAGGPAALLLVVLCFGPHAVLRLVAGLLAVLTSDEERGQRCLDVLRVLRGRDTPPPSPPSDSRGLRTPRRRGPGVEG
jgi:hypothetical protein